MTPNLLVECDIELLQRLPSHPFIFLLLTPSSITLLTYSFLYHFALAIHYYFVSWHHPRELNPINFFLWTNIKELHLMIQSMCKNEMSC